MKSLSSLFVFALMSISIVATGSTLKLGSDSNSISTKARSIEKEYSRDMRNGTVPAASEASIVNSFDYPSNLKMKEDRRAGAGLLVGGAGGMLGAIFELNIEDADSALATFGTGPGYNSVQVGWKHSFEGSYLTPYTTVSYSRWYNSRGRTTNYSESDILDRVLTDNEKKQGQFGTDFLNASLGLQYNQLTGDLAGLAVFAELTAMYEINRTMLIPTGAAGALYYF